jgi:dipeptidase
MCDTLCVRHDAGMWFAKNSDRHPDEVQLVEWHDRRSPGAALRTQYLTVPDAGAHAFLGSRPAWLWGCEHGVNEHGVAVGNQKIFTSDDPRRLPPALLGMDVVRLALERARSAADALVVCTSMIEQYGQGGSGEPHRDEPYFSSFLVTDAREGWIIETSDRTWGARPVGSGASISNRAGIELRRPSPSEGTHRTLGSPLGHDRGVRRARVGHNARGDRHDAARSHRQRERLLRVHASPGVPRPHDGVDDRRPARRRCTDAGMDVPR